MSKSDNDKIMITAMIIVGLLILKCVVSNGTTEHLDPSTAEWIEQPTDIVMPSINEEALKNKKYPVYQPHMNINEKMNKPKREINNNTVTGENMIKQDINNNIAKSHLIFKDGNIPRDYVLDENMKHPEEVLDSAELLPDDENNTWTDVNPQGSGSIAYKNFLDVGHHIGQINVLRNSDTSLRVQYPNPQYNVGPWRQTSIIPNVHVGADSDICT